MAALLSSALIIGFIVVVVVVAASIAIQFAGAKAGPAGITAEYQSQPLLTPAERSFAGVLDGAVPDGVTWFAKVRLADVFVVRKGLSPSKATTAWNRINQKHIDFLLVQSSDFVPVAGLELDDSSHQQERRKARDAFVDGVFKSACLPLLHIPAKAAYNPAELRQNIAAVLAASISTVGA